MLSNMLAYTTSSQMHAFLDAGHLPLLWRQMLSTDDGLPVRLGVWTGGQLFPWLVHCRLADVNSSHVQEW